MSSIILLAIPLFIALWLIVSFWKRSRAIFQKGRGSGKFLSYINANFMLSVGIFVAVITITGLSPRLLDLPDNVVTGLGIGGLLLGMVASPAWLVWSIFQWFRRERNPTDVQTVIVPEKEKRVIPEPDMKVVDEVELSPVPTKRKFGDDGELFHAIDEIQSNGFSFSGNGKYSTQAINLVKGRYRIKYEFPAKGSITVILASTDDVDTKEEQILWESGKGSGNFVVKATGNYVFQIDPLFASENPKWKIEIETL